jgi:hypothetical protein
LHGGLDWADVECIAADEIAWSDCLWPWSWRKGSVPDKRTRLHAAATLS